MTNSKRKASDFVDETRLWQRHMELANFGATALGGVNRQALSNEEIDARKQLFKGTVSELASPLLNPMAATYLKKRSWGLSM